MRFVCELKRDRDSKKERTVIWRKKIHANERDRQTDSERERERGVGGEQMCLTVQSYGSHTLYNIKFMI